MTDWSSWRKHVDRIVDRRGRWLGIGDADGHPLFDLPEPAPGGLASPDQWMNSPDLSITLPAITPEGETTRAAEMFIMEGLRGFDPSGQAPPVQGDYTLLVALAGENGVVRRGGVVTHAEATDRDNSGAPQEMTIHALNLMDVWNTIPAASWPNAWWNATPYERTTDESEIPYSQPWLMARIEMATRPTFTLKHGKALFIIRRLAQESLDAAMMTQRDPGGVRWVDDPFHVVEVPEADESRVISLDARDGWLWDTIAAQARNAGILVGARLWWPGDPPVRCWTPATSSMTAEQVDISPSQGDPYRTLEYRSFDHPMVVLTAREV